MEVAGPWLVIKFWSTTTFSETCCGILAAGFRARGSASGEENSSRPWSRLVMATEMTCVRQHTIFLFFLTAQQIHLLHRQESGID